MKTFITLLLLLGFAASSDETPTPTAPVPILGPTPTATPIPTTTPTPTLILQPTAIPTEFLLKQARQLRENEPAVYSPFLNTSLKLRLNPGECPPQYPIDRQLREHIGHTSWMTLSNLEGESAEIKLSAEAKGADDETLLQLARTVRACTTYETKDGKLLISLAKDPNPRPDGKGRTLYLKCKISF